MKDSAVTKTILGNSTITVTGMYADDAKDSMEDIIKKLIIRRIYADNGVDLSEKQREYSKEKGGNSDEVYKKRA